MIIGNGLIAKAFINDFLENKNILIFASGVSNSQNNDLKEFLREKNLIQSSLKKRIKFVYFSTCSIEDPLHAENKYVQHKLHMENLISQMSENFLIVRLPQVAGKSENPNTLLNYLFSKIERGDLFNVFQNATRNIIDIDDIQKIINYIIYNNLANNSVVNIASPIETPILDIVTIFEDIVGKKANYKLLKSGSHCPVRNNLTIDVARQIDIKFDQTYLVKTLYKYYS
jgi:nucleoside-diphosphate-sugar epimerase